MSKKNILLIGLVLFLINGIGIEGSYAQQTQSGQAYTVDPELCALMLRKGREAFSRGKYTEAKDLFRKAIQADPNSQKAWSNYDLAQMYSVAEQFKNHGRIIQSTAPAPEETAGMPQPPSPVVAPATPPAKEKGKTVPAKKEKPVKEKGPAPSETKEVEPAKAGPPTGQPSGPPIPAPSPTKPPGGAKILNDEGC